MNILKNPIVQATLLTMVVIALVFRVTKLRNLVTGQA